MSTSSDFSWAATSAGVSSFEYPAVKTVPSRFEINGARSEIEAQRQGELQRVLQQARMEGQREGEMKARKVFEESLRNERQGLQQALTAFAEERKDYFRRVEVEVVQLAMTIARKVLHREANIDPNLLAGMARVSIERLAESSGVVLRVHASQEEEWRRFFAADSLAPAPEIVGDAHVAPECCTLSTQMGTTEIGIDSQLKEIEQGLFDLLAQRPGA